MEEETTSVVNPGKHGSVREVFGVASVLPNSVSGAGKAISSGGPERSATGYSKSGPAYRVWLEGSYPKTAAAPHSQPC